MIQNYNALLNKKNDPLAKLLIVFIFLCYYVDIQAQEIDRVLAQGYITSRTQNDVEGVTVYNNSSNKGTVTDEKGTFTLAITKGDEIYVSAVQYAPFTLTIDAEMVQNKKIGIFLNPAVNQLSEVIVKKYDLSGNLVVDAQNIKTVALDTEWDLSWETLYNDYVFTDDRSSAIRGNAARDALNLNNMPILGIDFVAIAKLLFPNKKPTQPQIRLSEREKKDKLMDLYPPQLVFESFNIPQEKSEDFLLFVYEQGISSSYLTEENSFKLFQLLEEKAALYLAQMKG